MNDSSFSCNYSDFQDFKDHFKRIIDLPAIIEAGLQDLDSNRIPESPVIWTYGVRVGG